METRPTNKEDWYSKSKEHWENAESTVDGMLGGNEKINSSDVKTSCELLEGLIKIKKIIPQNAIDCGAGIGRVTGNVLVNYFEEVDIVEQNAGFVQKAKEDLSNNTKVKNFYVSPLQNFNFEKSYNVIWVQWCLENLEDDDLVTFLKNCKKGLKKDGVIILKENIVSKGSKYWEEDYSKIRSEQVFKKLFNKSGLKIYRSSIQPNWPEDLLKVLIYVLE